MLCTYNYFSTSNLSPDQRVPAILLVLVPFLEFYYFLNCTRTSQLKADYKEEDQIYLSKSREPLPCRISVPS